VPCRQESALATMNSDLATFMATMVAQSRPLAVERAVALAREGYGLEVRAERLSGERDENFKLTAADSTPYLLKIAHAAEQPLVTELSLAALQHVAHSDPTLPCPRVIAARSGRDRIGFVDEVGSARQAYLLTFLPGRVVAAGTQSPRQRAACGRIAAQLSCALRGFEHPAARRPIIWDLRHTSRVGGLLDELGDLPYRQSALDLLAAIIPTVESQWPRLRQQVVHNDMNALNILVDPDDEARVTGVIDFGDLTHTALVADVAVTAAENIPEDVADLAPARVAINDIAGAYHQRLPLLEPELAVLSTLVAARLVTILVVHAWHLHHNPQGGHYAPFAADLIRARLGLARGLLR
jgi:hydroxylysine kinase